MKKASGLGWRWGTLVCLAFASACSTPQRVIFEQPAGATVHIKGLPPFKPPLSKMVKTRKVQAIALEFSNPTLQKLGFTKEQIAAVHRVGPARMDGRLWVAESRVAPIFRVTPEQVRAVLLENNMVSWKYMDPEQNKVLEYEGYPAQVTQDSP